MQSDDSAKFAESVKPEFTAWKLSPEQAAQGEVQQAWAVLDEEQEGGRGSRKKTTATWKPEPVRARRPDADLGRCSGSVA